MRRGYADGVADLLRLLIGNTNGDVIEEVCEKYIMNMLPSGSCMTDSLERYLIRQMNDLKVLSSELFEISVLFGDDFRIPSHYAKLNEIIESSLPLGKSYRFTTY